MERLIPRSSSSVEEILSRVVQMSQASLAHTHVVHQMSTVRVLAPPREIETARVLAVPQCKQNLGAVQFGFERLAGCKVVGELPGHTTAGLLHRAPWRRVHERTGLPFVDPPVSWVDSVVAHIEGDAHKRMNEGFVFCVLLPACLPQVVLVQACFVPPSLHLRRSDPQGRRQHRHERHTCKILYLVV